MTGLYLSSSDIQRYINDYFEYGIDYTSDDNISSEDMWDFTKEPVDKSTGTDGEVYWDRELEKKIMVNPYMIQEPPKVLIAQHQIKKSMMRIGKRFLVKRKRRKKINELFSIFIVSICVIWGILEYFGRVMIRAHYSVYILLGVLKERRTNIFKPCTYVYRNICYARGSVMGLGFSGISFLTKSMLAIFFVWLGIQKLEWIIKYLFQ